MGISAESLQNTDISGAYFYALNGALVRVPSITFGGASGVVGSIAANGTIQSTATPITAPVNIVTSASASNNAVILNTLNSTVEIWNVTPVSLQLFPYSGYAFNNSGTIGTINAAVTFPPGHVKCIQTSGTAYTAP